MIALQPMFEFCSQHYSRNLKLRKTRWAAWYTFATFGMFTSTSIYWGFILYDTFIIAGIAKHTVDTFDLTIASVQDCLVDGEHGSPCSIPELYSVTPDIAQLAYHKIPLEYCVGTAALTTNVCSSLLIYPQACPVSC